MVPSTDKLYYTSYAVLGELSTNTAQGVGTWVYLFSVSNIQYIVIIWNYVDDNQCRLGQCVKTKHGAFVSFEISNQNINKWT